MDDPRWSKIDGRPPHDARFVVGHDRTCARRSGKRAVGAGFALLDDVVAVFGQIVVTRSGNADDSHPARIRLGGRKVAVMKENAERNQQTHNGAKPTPPRRPATASPPVVVSARHVPIPYVRRSRMCPGKPLRW